MKYGVCVGKKISDKQHYGFDVTLINNFQHQTKSIDTDNIPQWDQMENAYITDNCYIFMNKALERVKLIENSKFRLYWTLVWSMLHQ